MTFINPADQTRYVKPAEAAQIVALRRRGLTIKAIGEEVDRTHHAVRRALDLADVPRVRAESQPSAKMLKRARSVKSLALRGYSRPEICERLKLSRTQFQRTLARLELRDALALMSTDELAAELGISVTGLATAAAQGRIQATRWFDRWMFTPAQAKALREHHAGRVTPEDAEVWLTSTQTARELGISLDLFLVRFRADHASVQGIRRVRVLTAGRSFRYGPPQAILAAAQRSASRLPPSWESAGLLRAAELGALANRKADTVAQWARLGCPHCRDCKGANGRIWFSVPDVLIWLDARPDPKIDLAAATLRRNTEQRRAA